MRSKIGSWEVQLHGKTVFAMNTRTGDTAKASVSPVPPKTFVKFAYRVGGWDRAVPKSVHALAQKMVNQKARSEHNATVRNMF